MHFPVSQCSSYDDSRLPSKRDMEKIAWILLTKKAGRSIGFVTSKQFREIEGEDAEIIPPRRCTRSNRHKKNKRRRTTMGSFEKGEPCL
jgi:hypothetical protein